MKKITLILTALCAGAICAGAQSIADNEYRLRNNFWFGTDNASALAEHYRGIRNDLSLSYDYENGDYHLQQNPASLNDISLSTSGVGKVGGFVLWGGFSFHNIFEQGARYNVLNYTPEEDMPYFVADTFASGWNKQAYLMSVKLASPVLWNAVSFGIKVDYNAKVGAKQKDPRSETYDRYVAVYPSATIALGAHSLGVYALYDNQFERTDPTNANLRQSQKVFISNGLGMGLVGKVGDNDGLDTFFYRGYNVGGALQYGFDAERARIYTELRFSHGNKTSTQKPSLPKPMGKIVRNAASFDFKGSFGRSFNHLVSLGATMGLTSGIEYLLNLNTTAFEQNWEIITENPMSSFTRVDAHAGYEYQKALSSDRYDWSAGVDADFTMRDYSYLSPTALFNSTGTLLSAKAAKQFVKGAHSFLVGLNGGYNLSFGSEYLYTGPDKTAALQKMYIDDAILLGSNYYKFGARLAYALTSGNLHYNFDLRAAYLRAPQPQLGRVTASLTASLLF